VRWRKTLRASAGTPYRADGIWRIDDVPICSTGIEYPLSTGPHTFTESELASAVEAASGRDVAINPPRIKLGHKSEANQFYLGEDEPAFGRVENLRLSENKQTILGNYVGTPEWLSKVLPVAYPSRSVDARLGVETATGKRYEMVITDVSLLGVMWPGCSVLEDLPLWYGSETPEGVELAAAADVVSIRRKFYKDGPGQNGDWWIRGERFDSVSGYNLIVDEGNGDIVRIPVAVDGDKVDFGDAVPVVEDYPDKALAAKAALRGMQLADPAMRIYASRTDTDEEGETMDEELRLSLAKRLGLPENATEEQIRSELAKPVSETPPGGDGDDDGDDGDDGDGDGDEGTPPPASETVTIDRGTYEQLTIGARLAVEHEGERIAARVSNTVEAAVKDGRIPPARREHWTKALTADFDGTKTVLDGLEPGVIPVTVRGSVGPGDDDGVTNDNANQGLPDEWFPEIATIRAQASKGRRVVNAKEG